MHETRLSNNTTLRLETAHADTLFVNWIDAQTAQIIIGGHRATLHLIRRAQLQQTAPLAGAAIHDLAPDAFALCLTLALIAHTGKLPGRMDLVHVRAVAIQVHGLTPAPLIPTDDLRPMVDAMFRPCIPDLPFPLHLPWVPDGVMTDFVRAIIPQWTGTATYDHDANQWQVSGTMPEPPRRRSRKTEAAPWGTPTIDALTLIRATLQGDDLPDPLAQAQQRKLIQHFEAWIWDDPQRLTDLSHHYNTLVLTDAHVAFPAPAGVWNLARFCIRVGLRAWALTGMAAAWWGTSPTVRYSAVDDIQTKQRELLALLATLVGPPALPVPLAQPSTEFGNTWVDWLSLSSGPTTVPPALVADGLGYPSESILAQATDDNLMSLTYEQGQALTHAAMTLLSIIQRPAPRYIGQLLDCVVPAEILPELARWEITVIRVIPHSDGLWVALLDQSGHTAALCWWRATPGSMARAPISIPAAAWALLHPVLAGLWHDLCAEAVVVEPTERRPRKQADQRKQAGNVPKGKPKKKVTYLPPKHYRAQWADQTSLDEITRVKRAGYTNYRRLPEGWETVKHPQAAAKRREAAIARAYLAGWPAPPPGFTFQLSTTVVGAETTEAPAAVHEVRSHGLFTVCLSLYDVRVLEVTEKKAGEGG